MRKPKNFVLPNHPDTSPELFVERGEKGDGVGTWVPNEKHTLLAKYIDATKYAQNKFPQRIFIDPFCGPGRIQVKGETTTRHGGALIAWHQSIKSQCNFTKVIVGDIDEQKLEACRIRLQNAGANVSAFIGSAKETVPEMIKAIPSGSLCLAYLDPYNLKYLSFSIIKALAALPKIDFVVHFSLMDLNRNIDIELGERDRFSDASPDWKIREKKESISKANLGTWFFNDWTNLIKQLGFKFSEEIPLITNSQSGALYYLVFFSRNEFPDKIWNDIAKGDTLDLFDN